jgi:protein-tyrosine phosphatase
VVIDLHAHLLPGLDDGPRSIEQSLALCRALLDQGVTCAVATPHMFDGVYEVPREAVYDGVRALAARLAQAGVPLRVLPGADIRVDGRVLEAARAGELVCLGGRAPPPEQYVLLELPADLIPPGFDWFLDELGRAGYAPVLSHPERSAVFQGDRAALEEFCDAGMLVQVSVGSLTGDFGRRARASAREMLRRGLVHVLASDCHDLKRRPPRLAEGLAEAARLIGPGAARALVEANPAAILAGEPLPFGEPAARGKKDTRCRFPGGPEEPALSSAKGCCAETTPGVFFATPAAAVAAQGAET